MRSLRTANLTAAWGVVFAIVHAYWATGGEAGMNGDPADTTAAQLYIAFIAALGLAGAAVARGIARGHRAPALVLLARTGGVALLLGVLVGAGRWLADWSLDGDGAAGIAITVYFLLGAFLFSSLGWRAADTRPRFSAPYRASGSR
jgi:hypothetical protein